MGVFEYLGVLVSVIMGLGITHLATGAAKLIQHRDEARPYLPHALWTLNVLLYILLIWWGMFWWSGHQDWYAYEYLFIALYAIVLFLLAAMLYPLDMDRDIDVQAYFFGNRRWFFGTLFAAWLVDVPETLLKAMAGLRDVPADYVIFVALHLAIAAIGFFSGSLLKEYLQAQSHAQHCDQGAALVQVGHLYKSRNAERNAVHATRRARPTRALALLRALRRVPPCAAARVAPKPLSDALSPQILFQQAAGNRVVHVVLPVIWLITVGGYISLPMLVQISS